MQRVRVSVKNGTQNTDLEKRVADCITCNSEGRERGRLWRKEGEFHFGCDEFQVAVRYPAESIWWMQESWSLEEEMSLAKK